MQTVEIENVGPISRLSIPLPEGGGICVLRGKNGAGKSQALTAVDSLATGRGKLNVRQGEVRGLVEGLGATITVGRTTRRSVDELEVLTLEGRLSVADLVEPGIDNPEAADAKRIKALVQLAGAQADGSLFVPLLGGKSEFDAVVSPAALETDELITMAARIKRDFEAAARRHAAAAETAGAHAKAQKDQAEGVDLSVSSDPAELQAKLEHAIRNQGGLKAAWDAAEEATKRRERASQALSYLKSGYRGPTAEEASADERNAGAELTEARAKFEIATQALRHAEGDMAACAKVHEAKTGVFAAAEQHEKLVAGWETVLAESESVYRPAPESLSLAESSVLMARKALEAGTLARKAREGLERVESYLQSAKVERAAEERMRSAASGVDDVLSSLVAKAGTPLRVEGGRLVIGSKRGKTYFGELSEGERWRIALDVAIDAVGPKGLLVIPQAAFEAMDPLNRRAIAEHVKGRGVTILTAEASADEEVTAEVFDADTDAA